MSRVDFICNYKAVIHSVSEDSLFLCKQVFALHQVIFWFNMNLDSNMLIHTTLIKDNQLNSFRVSSHQGSHECVKKSELKDYLNLITRLQVKHCTTQNLYKKFNYKILYTCTFIL